MAPDQVRPPDAIPAGCGYTFGGFCASPPDVEGEIVSKHLLPVGLACLVTFAGLTGCAPTPGGSGGGPKGAPVKAGAPRGTPKAGDVATGTGTLESVRRQLEGKWEMTALEVVDAAGKIVPVTATGLITYDAYGNFDLSVRMDEAAAKAVGANVALDLRGRAVIDVANSSLRVQDADATTGTPRAANVNPVRHYAFDGDTLTLTVKDATGKTTSSSKWKRQ